MKKYSLVVLYNVISIILLFLLLELVVRIFVPQIRLPGTSAALIVDSLYNDSPGIRSDTSGISGGILKESNRYHSWKYLTPVSANTHKLLFLGDSVTMGIGVENDSTYAGIINNNIDSINVINPSLIGYSSKDYLNVVDYFLIRKKFNLNFSSVVIFWTLNDIYSNYPDNESPELSSNGFIGNIISFLRSNSKAYQFLKNLFSDRPKTYYEYDRRFYTDSNPLLQRSVTDILKISSICDSLKIKFQIVLLPYEYQIRNYNTTGIFQPQRLLKEKLKNSNIETIDPAGLLRNDYDNSIADYLYGDGIHFNERGNSVIAYYIKSFL